MSFGFYPGEEYTPFSTVNFKKGLKIAHLNTQKLSSHYEELKRIMIKEPVYILTISETWLTDTNHSEGDYDIPVNRITWYNN